MPVAEWALPDCVLLLWVPGPHTLQGLELMAAWGFSFKGTGFVWIKTNRTCPGYAMGTGYGTRKNAEFCWQGTRGSPRRLSTSVRELVVEPRRLHSQKPDCVRTRIEQLYPGPYLELFARSTLPGWDCHATRLACSIVDQLKRGGSRRRWWMYSDVCRLERMPCSTRYTLTLPEQLAVDRGLF
jgi:N6-adenosine-specific RNA methylase IME4